MPPVSATVKFHFLASDVPQKYFHSTSLYHLYRNKNQWKDTEQTEPKIRETKLEIHIKNSHLTYKNGPLHRFPGFSALMNSQQSVSFSFPLFMLSTVFT